MHQTNQAMLACQTTRRERVREGLHSRHPFINARFIQPALCIHLTCWKVILKTNASAVSLDNDLHVYGKAFSKKLSATEMFPLPQTPVVRHITLLNWNARLSLCKLLLLLIFPFPTLKMTCNSDILQSAGACRRYSSIQMQRLQWEAGRKLLRLSIFVIFYNHHNMTWYVQLFSPSLLQGNIIFRLRRPSWRMKLFTRVKWASPRAARQSFPVRPGSTFWVSATTESVNAGYLGSYKHACSLSEYPNVVL